MHTPRERSFRGKFTTNVIFVFILAIQNYLASQKGYNPKISHFVELFNYNGLTVALVEPDYLSNLYTGINTKIFYEF